MDTTRKYPQFILFGDSIIQFTSFLSNGGYIFGAGLQEHCSRRLDVINRGLSGYTTAQGLRVFSEIMPSPSSAKVDYLLIMFGANDACLRSSPSKQHIPLEEYQSNLKKLINHPAVRAQDPTIVLVTPPPINELHLQAEDLKKGYSALTRHQAVTGQYAAAVREVAAEAKGEGRSVILVDLWTVLAEEAKRLTDGYAGKGELLGTREMGESEAMRSLLVDGLHLTGDGYRIFLKEILPLIGSTWAQETFDSPSWIFPHWTRAPRIE